MTDPRIERSRMVILQAAVEELAEVGYGAFTIESVAARAGVGKSTIYRHWPDKLALLAPIFYRRLMSGEPFDPNRAGELLETVFGPPRGLRKRAPGTSAPSPRSPRGGA